MTKDILDQLDELKAKAHRLKSTDHFDIFVSELGNNYDHLAKRLRAAEKVARAHEWSPHFDENCKCIPHIEWRATKEMK